MALACLGACGNGSEDPDRPAASRWPTSSSPLQPEGLVWAKRSVIHLGTTGPTIDVGSDVATYVVAGDGVFYTLQSDEAGDASQGGDLVERPLHYTDGADAAREVAPSAATLRVSPDGRYLAYLDLSSGEPDDFGTPQIEVVVRDLRSGEEVVRSTEGMGDPDTDDLAALYPEAPPAVLGVDDDAAYVDTSDGRVLALDLASGETRPARESQVGPPWADGDNPSHTWQIDPGASKGLLTPKQGEPVVPRVAGGRPVVLRAWIDDDTVYGFVDQEPYPLVTCVVPSGACTVVPGSAHDHIVMPDGFDTSA